MRQLFRASRIGTIAGSHVTEGKVTRGARVRVVREGTVIYDTTIASLRRFNEDVREVAAGFECGIVLNNFQDLREGDVLETYETRQVERELSPDAAGRCRNRARADRRARMSTGRMRRVDEAIRQVIGERSQATQGPTRGIRDRDRCQDQPRPGHARVYVSVLGDGRASATSARHAGRAAQRPRLPAAAGGLRAAPEAHARRSSSSTTRRPTARCASSS